MYLYTFMTLLYVTDKISKGHNFPKSTLTKIFTFCENRFGKLTLK